MTCDTDRPCQRCVQRGLADSCQDAPRKRKKYLADVPLTVLGQSTSEKSDAASYDTAKETNSMQGTSYQQSPVQSINYISPMNEPSNEQDLQNLGYYGGTNMFQPNTNNYINQKPGMSPANQNQTKDKVQQMYKAEDEQYNKPKRTNFLSSAADLEYSTLSSILQDNFVRMNPNATLSDLNSPAVQPHKMATADSKSISSPNSMHGYDQPNKPLSYASGSSHTSSPNDNIPHTSLNDNGNKKTYKASKYSECDENINQYFLGPTGTDKELIFPDVITAIEEMRTRDPAVYNERASKLTLSFAIGIIPEDDHYSKDGKAEVKEPNFKEPEEIYANVNKPFSYTPGYHLLIAYLRKRFPKEMLVKMAESMAAYRPSFIACTNSLKESDLIFMEQCFQRTLLTYDNFIKVSGTPTIVWRRTGEIAYVGSEFCVLTGWTKDELIFKNKKFIVELLDDKSVVEYFQLFLRIAFGDFMGATMTECTLLTPKKDVKIRTGCMWTLKRDVFGIPMMIIGNFLPII